MNRGLLAPIVIEIMIPIVVIVPAIFLPISPTADFEPNPVDVFPALLNPSYPIYYIILSAVFIQGLLVNRYLLHVPIRKDYSSSDYQSTHYETWWSEYPSFFVYENLLNSLKSARICPPNNVPMYSNEVVSICAFHALIVGIEQFGDSQVK